MRQLRARAYRPRVLLVAAISAIAAAGSGSISTAGHTAAQADCSEATASQLVEQHRLNNFLLPNPVQQVLCGPFTGPGSEAMAITIAAPTCWGIQRWAVFRFSGGAWQLVLDQHEFVFPPLVAVGVDIRVRTPVFRKGDPRCIPSGGSHARTWHWNGTRFTAGPYTQVTPGAPIRSAAFHSPSANIECGMVDDRRSAIVECWTFRPPQKVWLYASGRLRICRGSEARCKLGNIGEEPTLAYGRQITVGRFRCLSLKSGVRCTVTRSRKGFLISRSGVTRVGP
jgi:hypothetical protein